MLSTIRMMYIFSVQYSICNISSFDVLVPGVCGTKLRRLNIWSELGPGEYMTFINDLCGELGRVSES